MAMREKKSIPVEEGKNETHFYPTPKQEIALSCTCQTILFGGARGGGKSFCSYLKILQHVQLYKEKAKILFLRKSLKELEQIIDDCKIVFKGIADWKEQKKRFEFKNGAIAEFNYLDGEAASNYQGHQYTLIICDEVGNFSSYEDVKLLKGCLRSASGVPCQLFMTCNPGGPLHNILKAEFIDPAPKGMVPIEDVDILGKPLGTYRVYIPAWLFENPYLMKNDPTYVQRLKQTGSPEMVRAWLKGDWDVISGGAFDKLFDRDIHVIKPFSVPHSWRIVGCYDDGMSRPAAMLWFAISDGTDYTLPNGEKRSTIRGDIFVIAELYFWTGKANEGTNESTQSKAERIKEKEKALGYEISQRIADKQIFSSKSRSTADEFEENGISFEPCDKAPGTRLIAANLFRNALNGSLIRMEKPGIFFFSTCTNCIRTIPTLPRDKREPDDVDSKAEDHCLHGDTIIHTIEYGSVPIRELVGKEGLACSANTSVTHSGLYDFYDVKKTGVNQKLIRVIFEDKSELICTPDHEIFCHGMYNDFIQADCFNKNRIIGNKNETILKILLCAEKPPSWYRKNYKAIFCSGKHIDDKDKIKYKRIINVEDAGAGDVYCMKVKGVNSFCANSGVIVHNCYDPICYLLLSDYDAEVQYGSAGNS